MQGGLFPNRIWLNDYSQYESTSILKSVLSRELSAEEERLVQLSGGIPELLHALIWGIKNGAATQSWSSVHREIRSVIDLIGARSFLLERLYELQAGSSDFQSKSDHILKQAGLVRTDLINGVRVSSLRAPYVSEVLRLDSV
ncbi:MAG: hypothetical protein VX278_10625 [Myxococcota bacterium]|nr:hypothetical protein [Myxococcota bacterium]